MNSGDAGDDGNGGSTAQDRLGLTADPAVCYRLPRSRVHPGNVGLELIRRRDPTTGTVTLVAP